MLRSDIIGPKGHPDCRQPSWREYGLLQSDALLGRQVFWNIKVNFGWLLGRSHPSSRDSGVCLFYLYCNIVASQCCVSFCCTMTFPLDLPLTLPPHSSPLGHHRAWNNLCYRAASHSLAIDRSVCVCVCVCVRARARALSRSVVSYSLWPHGL